MWELRDKAVLLLEEGDRLGGRLKSDPCGEYWMNLGAHLFPGAGSKMHDIIRSVGLDTVEIPGATTALYLNGRVHQGRHVETYPLTLPLGLGARVALAKSGVRLVRHVRRWRRANRLRGGEAEIRVGAHLPSRSRYAARARRLDFPVRRTASGGGDRRAERRCRNIAVRLGVER